MQDQRVYFVIVTYNGCHLLDACLASVYRQTAGPASIVLVDNGSEDGTEEHVRRNHPEVTLIRVQENIGFVAACNLGIKTALTKPACRYVGLMNDDAWLADDWLATVLAFAEDNPDGASFQGLTLDGRDHEVVDSFGLCIGHGGRAMQLGYRSRIPSPGTGEVFGVNGAAALYSSAFLSTQPFGDDYLDPDLFMYLEDVDLAARAVVMGWRNYFVAEACAFHLGSGGDRENRLPSLRMTSRNDLPVLVKNLPWPVVLRTLPGLVHSELARHFGFIRAREYARSAAMLRGRLAGLAQLPRFMRKRRVLRPYRSISNARLWRLMAGEVVPAPAPISRQGE